MDAATQDVSMVLRYASRYSPDALPKFVERRFGAPAYKVGGPGQAQGCGWRRCVASQERAAAAGRPMGGREALRRPSRLWTRRWWRLGRVRGGFREGLKAGNRPLQYHRRKGS